jgi:hypothetical protein
VPKSQETRFDEACKKKKKTKMAADGFGRIPRKKHLNDKHEKDLAQSCWDEPVDSRGWWDQKLISTKQMDKKLVIVRFRILRARGPRQKLSMKLKNKMSTDCSIE